MTIPTLNLNKLRQPESDAPTPIEKKNQSDSTEESSQDSSQKNSTSAKPSMSTTSAQQVQNPLASPLASHRHTEKSSPPIVSPRSAPPNDAPPSLPSVSLSPLRSQSTTTTATSATATSTHSPKLTSTQSSTSASTNSSSSSSSTSSTNNKVVVFKLPNPNIIMKPAELAKLLIAADSMNYQIPLSKSQAESMLRGNTKILGSSDKDAEPVNVNETYLAPFMNKYFDTPGVIKMQDTVIENYTKESDQIHTLYNKIGDARNFARSDEAAAMMVPLIKPIINFICGKDMSLESSGLPKPVLELMLAVDEEVIIWFNKNGSGDPADLVKARQNALTSFFGTRSFMGTWTILLSSDKSKPARFYQPLVGYLNTYLNLQIKNFTSKLMTATDKQRKVISKQAAIVDSRLAPSSSKSASAVSTLTDKLREPDKSEKKGGFFNFFKKEDKPEVVSPRGKKETEVMHSPRRQLKRGDTLQENANREVTHEKNRSKFINQFSRSYKLEQNPEFFRHFKDSVLKLEREQYKIFKADPLKYCIDCLGDYTSQFIAGDSSTPDQSTALINLLADLSAAVGKDSSQNSQ